jgi:hypothetical protein
MSIKGAAIEEITQELLQVGARFYAIEFRQGDALHLSIVD